MKPNPNIYIHREKEGGVLWWERRRGCERGERGPRFGERFPPYDCDRSSSSSSCAVPLLHFFQCRWHSAHSLLRSLPWFRTIRPIKITSQMTQIRYKFTAPQASAVPAPETIADGILLLSLRFFLVLPFWVPKNDKEFFCFFGLMLKTTVRFIKGPAQGLRPCFMINGLWLSDPAQSKWVDYRL